MFVQLGERFQHAGTEQFHGNMLLERVAGHELRDVTGLAGGLGFALT